MHIILSMPQIGKVGKFLIYAFPRDATGKHDNNYIKIKQMGTKGLVVGKWLLDIQQWDGTTKLTAKEKKSILAWLQNNMQLVDNIIKN